MSSNRCQGLLALPQHWKRLPIMPLQQRVNWTVPQAAELQQATQMLMWRGRHPHTAWPPHTAQVQPPHKSGHAPLRKSESSRPCRKLHLQLTMVHGTTVVAVRLRERTLYICTRCRIKRKKERPPLVERPQAPEAPPVRRGLFSTTALPVPVTTASAPKEGPPLNQAVQANQPQQEQRVLAGSPALQTLLQLQPSLDPSTRAGVVNVLRQWGVQPQGATTFALLPVSAAQQPVQQPMDDFELLRHTLKTLLLLVERIAGVHIKPADPDATLPVSVLAREAGQNELYTLVPLVRV